MRTSTLAPLVLAIIASTRLAHADPKAEAKTHVDRAMVHHKQMNYPAALEELTLAYKLDPQPGLLYAIAQVHVKLDHCADAITFYERFLETNPEAKASAAAREAINVCKAKLPKPEPEPKPEIKPEPKPELKPAPAVVAEATVEPKPVAPPIDKPARRAWYKDPIGGVLVGSGVVAGAVAVVFQRSASKDIDAAGAAATYGESEVLVDRADGKRLKATIAAAGGIALVGAGVVRYFLVSRSSNESAIAIVPTTDGAAISWSGRF